MSEVHTLDEKFKLGDAASYDDCADLFDRFQACSSGPLVAQLVQLAELAGARRVLDIGTGTGVVALAAAARVGPEGKVVGIDLSEGMLAMAREQAARAGREDRLAFRRMDAEALELADQSFDAILSLFALFHFPDPLRVLREIFRVLAPGGRLVLAVGSGAPLLSLAGLAHRLRRIPGVWLRLRGKRLTAPDFLNSLLEKHLPDAAAPEVLSWVKRRFGMRSAVCRLIREAGFTRLRTDWVGHEIILETPEAFWDLQTTFSSLARKRLAGATDERREALRHEFFRTCTDVQKRGGTLTYPSAAFFVRAERPVG
jgi:O-methyltransferase/aklanonic acid methyltransferase